MRTRFRRYKDDENIKKDFNKNIILIEFDEDKSMKFRRYPVRDY